MNAERTEEKVVGSTVEEERAKRRRLGRSERHPARERERRRAEREEGEKEKEGREERRWKRETFESGEREGRPKRRTTAESGIWEGREVKSRGWRSPEMECGARARRDLWRAAEKRSSTRAEEGEEGALVLSKAERGIECERVRPPWRMTRDYFVEIMKI